MGKINNLNKNYKREYILGLENPEINDRKYWIWNWEDE
jgi:hypothetical protein